MNLKEGWTGIKITMIANDHRCVLLCDNDKWCDRGKDLSYFNFAGQLSRTKAHTTLRMHDLFRVHWLRPSGLISNSKQQLHDKGIQVRLMVIKLSCPGFMALTRTT